MRPPQEKENSLEPRYVSLLTKAQIDLYAFICMLLGHRDDAEDILQETNLMLMRHAAEYDGQRAFLPWAKAFAYNQVRKYLKSRSRSPLVFSGELVDAIADDALREEGADRHELELLDRCIKKLTPAQRGLIQNRYFEDQSVESLAGRMNKSPVSVYVQIHRIRKLLGKCIESYLRTEKLAEVSAEGGT